MEAQKLGSVIYVTVERLGEEPSVTVEPLYRGSRRMGFFSGGMTFSWVGDTLTVVGAPGRRCSITHLDEPVETQNSLGTAFRVAVFPTERTALAFLANSATQPAIAA